MDIFITNKYTTVIVTLVRWSFPKPHIELAKIPHNLNSSTYERIFENKVLPSIKTNK